MGDRDIVDLIKQRYFKKKKLDQVTLFKVRMKLASIQPRRVSLGFWSDLKMRTGRKDVSDLNLEF